MLNKLVILASLILLLGCTQTNVVTDENGTTTTTEENQVIFRETIENENATSVFTFNKLTKELNLEIGLKMDMNIEDNPLFDMSKMIDFSEFFATALFTRIYNETLMIESINNATQNNSVLTKEQELFQDGYRLNQLTIDYINKSSGLSHRNCEINKNIVYNISLWVCNPIFNFTFFNQEILTS